jgi:thiol-disulfide isomerase/thioredoxin
VYRLAALSLVCISLAASARSQQLNAKSLLPGAPAPPLTADHILEAPPEATIDWPSLRGKAVVVEFWATWCVPCIAEIPLLNSLQASVDPAKVQFISLTDEDPAVIRRFLAAHPINGIVAVDSSSKTFATYGIVARPATILVGPDGRIVSANAHPETLTSAQLLAIANGQPVNFSDASTPAAFDPKVLAQRDALLKEGYKSTAPESANALFEISLTPGEPGDGHIMQRGPTQYDITNVDLKTLLDFAAHLPAGRTTFATPLPDTQYNLHVQAPNADPAEVAHAVELAIVSAAHLRIERHTAEADALVLTALPGAQTHFDPASAAGMAFYNPGTKSLMCMHATAAQIGKALEKSLHKPVVDESALEGTFSDSIAMDPTDLAAANKGLAQAGLQLTPARRPIESYTVAAVK